MDDQELVILFDNWTTQENYDITTMGYILSEYEKAKYDND